MHVSLGWHIADMAALSVFIVSAAWVIVAVIGSDRFKW